MNIYKELKELGFYTWLNKVEPDLVIPSNKMLDQLFTFPIDSITIIMCSGPIFKWFRDEHKLLHQIYNNSSLIPSYDITIERLEGFPLGEIDVNFESHEIAERVCIEKLINLIK